MDAEKPMRVVYHFDRFTLDLARGALLAPDGTELSLRPKSFALLQLLVESAGRLLDRDAIMRAVWPDVFVTDDSITQCVHEIRRVLGDEAQRLLRTVPRRGYLFAAEVSRTAAAMAVPEELSRPPTDQPARLVRPSTALGAKPEQAYRNDMLDPPASEHTHSPELSPSSGAERRHLTVLFCDLVGSTPLTEQLDPEDLASIMRSYRERCTAAITGCGGHVARYMGDGVLAFFGYPHAREDATERAVRAGLAIIEATDDLKPTPGPVLQVRVGIATGLVVDDQASEGAQGQVAVGRPLNLAARLQTIAEPGTVVIADSTRRLIGSLFALEDLGPQLLKGFTEPVRAWRVTGTGVVESRFEALRGASLTPLVGRVQELTLLLDRWEHAKEGEGQVVLLTGEPGIGKSRLVQALRDRLAGEPHVHLGFYCSPYHQDSPLRPVIAHLERAASFTRGDDPGQKLAKLESLLAHGEENGAQLVPLIASLLSIPSDGRSPSRDISPQQQRERTLAGLVEQLAGLAAHRPVLLVWEDVHWADPTSLELLGLVIDRLQSLPVLALITFRPEFTPPWPGHTHATSLTLNRLSRGRCSQMVAALAGGKALPAVVLDQILAKAEGVPLFLEELTKAVLESGLLREEEDRHELAGPLPPSAIPATLQDSLMARLDRLAPVKEVAQVAAVIGREFSHELLAAIIPQEEELAEALHRLTAAELVFRRGMAPPHATYVFKHALLRDAAYTSLLKGRRRQLHARIVQVLEERFPDRAECEPELLAHHCAQAELAEKGAMYHCLAGRHAIARAAMAEAVMQLRAGLNALADVPDGPGRRRQELDLQLALGTALAVVGSYMAPETGRAFARARELCQDDDDPQRLFAVLYGHLQIHLQRGEPCATQEVAAEMLERARREGDAALLAPAHRAMCVAAFHLGRFAAARAHAEQALALYDPARHRSLAAMYTFDQRTVALGPLCLALLALGPPDQLCLALLALGHPDQARARNREHLAWACEVRHPNSLARAQSFACFFHFAAQDPPALLQQAAEATIATTAEHGVPFHLGIGRIFRGQALIEQGAIEDGLADIEQGKVALEASGSRPLLNVNSLLAEAHARAGRHREALRWAAEAQAQTEASPSFWLKAEELRRRGRLLLLLPNPDQAEAEACLQRAIEVARSQGARMWELRAATDLARVWRGQARYREARDLLAPVYGWFTEGFETPDLKEARALLEKLA